MQAQCSKNCATRLPSAPEAVHPAAESVPPAPAAQLLHRKESLLRLMLCILQLEMWPLPPAPKQMLPSPHAVQKVAESVPPTPERMAPAPPAMHPLT